MSLLIHPARERHLARSPIHLLKLHRGLLQEGNSKLSRNILTFGLPVIATCPGASDACKKACYAAKGRYHGSFSKRRRAENLILAKREDFAELVIRDLANRGQRILRPHDSGDFFSAAYLRSWMVVADWCRNRGIQVFAYTRSWRDPELAPLLSQFGRRKNVRLWYSTDAETGLPKKAGKDIRIAYMQTAESDLPPAGVDLVFRDYGIRNQLAKRVGESLVCPYENGVVRLETKNFKMMNCHRCGLCWDKSTPARDPRHHVDDANFTRLSLPVLKFSS